MGFLKKHYEKILLAVLLTGFIGLLAFQLVLWRQNEQIQVEKLKGFKDPPPNYQPVKFDDEKSPFRVLQTLPSQLLFRKPVAREVVVARDGSLVPFTQFMTPYPMAVCPYCNRVIPANAFPAGDGEGRCPFSDCQKVLHAPYNLTQEKDLDTDEDGIPDKEEIRMGLNPKDGTDAAIDSDGDFFSNYEEFICKTDCKNPKSRPRYHEKMYVRSISRNKLLFKVRKITFDAQRQNAKINIEVERPRLTQNRFKTFLNREKGHIFPNLSYDEYRKKTPFYKIIGVTSKVTKNGAAEIDESFITVKRCNFSIKALKDKTPRDILVTDVLPPQPQDKEKPPLRFFYTEEGDEIQAVNGRDVYEPKVKAVIGINRVNDLKEKEYFQKNIITEGDPFKTGEDRYLITDINQKTNTVKVKYLGDMKSFVGKEYEIGSVSKLRQKLDEIQKTKRPRRRRRAKTN